MRSYGADGPDESGVSLRLPVRWFTLAAPPAVAPDTAPDTQEVTASRTTDTTPVVDKPTVVIPGVNGAPVSKPPKTGTSGTGGGNPFTPFTDFIKKGLDAVTGPKPTTSGTGSGSETSGGSDTGADE